MGSRARVCAFIPLQRGTTNALSKVKEKQRVDQHQARKRKRWLTKVKNNETIIIAKCKHNFGSMNRKNNTGKYRKIHAIKELS